MPKIPQHRHRPCFKLPSQAAAKSFLEPYKKLGERGKKKKKMSRKKCEGRKCLSGSNYSNIVFWNCNMQQSLPLASQFQSRAIHFVASLEWTRDAGTAAAAALSNQKREWYEGGKRPSFGRYLTRSREGWRTVCADAAAEQSKHLTTAITIALWFNITTGRAKAGRLGKIAG